VSHASLPARLERGSSTQCRDCWSRRSASIRWYGQDCRALVWAKRCVFLKDWFGGGGNQVSTQARLRDLMSKVRGAALIVHSLGGGTIPGIRLTDCIGVLIVVCRSGGPRFTVGEPSFDNCFAEVQSDATADQSWGRTKEQRKPKGGFPVVLLVSEPVTGRPVLRLRRFLRGMQAITVLLVESAYTW
jgi:hypothetical protein